MSPPPALLTNYLTFLTVQRSSWYRRGMWSHGRKRKQTIGAPATIWAIPDDLWAEIAPVIAALDPPGRRGPVRKYDPRAVLNALIYRMRTGCQWNRLPKEFPDDSTVHRVFQRWVHRGVLERIWVRCIGDAGSAVAWEWQAVDGTLGKARLGGMASGRTQLTEARRE